MAIDRSIGPSRPGLQDPAGFANRGTRASTAALKMMMTDDARQRVSEQHPGLASQEFPSDNYLKFPVEELKPFIDETYRTRLDAKTRFSWGRAWAA